MSVFVLATPLWLVFFVGVQVGIWAEQIDGTGVIK